VKTFYCVEDIERLAARGRKELVIDEGIVLTDLARDTARQLGISLVYRSCSEPVAAVPSVSIPASPVGSTVGPDVEPKGHQVKPRIFLDSADARQVEKAMESGVVSGIATNSSKVAEMGKTVETVYREIASIFDGPIAVQAVGSTAEELIRHARELDNLGPNVVVKVPTTSEGVKAISRLVKEGVQTNATLIFRPSQALAAALAGTPIISPFIGRANDIGLDGIATIAEIRKVYDAFGLDVLVIAASVRNVEQAINSIVAGADAIAVRYEIFEQMLKHPLTEVGAAKFLQDVQRTRGPLGGGQPEQPIVSGGSSAVVNQLVDLVRQLGDEDLES
jgi:transaldolase